VSQFTFTISQVEDPFGGSVTVGPATVTIDAACYFDDEAASENDFYALFTGLQAGESLEVEVYGLSLAGPNLIQAFEIEAEIDD
jgi:hypothetical protein